MASWVMRPHPQVPHRAVPVLQHELRALDLLPDPPPADLEGAIRDALRLLADIAGFPATDDFDDALLQLAMAGKLLAATRALPAARFIPPDTPDIVLLMFRGNELRDYAALVSTEVDARTSRDVSLTTTGGLTATLTFNAEQSTPCSWVTALVRRGPIRNAIPPSRICGGDLTNALPRRRTLGFR